MTTTGTPTGMAAAACGRPGCDGTIEDGYCTSCGLAPQPTRTGSRGAGPAPAQPAAGSGPLTGSAPVSSRASGPASAGRGGRSGTIRSSRGRLGAGLVEVEPVPARDPASAVLADPQVAESKRFCGNCERPVGRSRGGQRGLAEGFCPHCGTRYSFLPRLQPGEMVAGQYEVIGCLAHGGLGWIYLAADHNLGQRWVVLKGLLNTGDVAALEAAVAERRFLAEVEHPSIVDVYNFVQHPDRRTGEQSGYIVMEYVGGRSLRQLLLDRRAAGESMPVPVALAYAIEVLPALGYLHGRGLVYCDFKPDNVIQTEEQLKLIDMGGVRRIDDEDSPIYGTVGYQAPEIAELGPSPSSDLYTVGRALAVLTFEFAGYQSTYQHSLPDPATVPALAQHNSFLRAIRRATSTDPRQRFGSASEMAEQLTGVLREVLSAADGQSRPAFSTLFSAELQAIGVPPAEQAGAAADSWPAPTPAQIAAGLPVPVVDATDPAAGFLATLSTLEPAQRMSALSAAVAGEQGTPAAVAESAETRYALARTLITADQTGRAEAELAAAAVAEPGDWRISWYQGLVDLADGKWGAACAAFDGVLDALPGELAPKLALGLAAEAAADLVTAASMLHVVWTTDRSFVTAAFALARIRLRAGNRAGALEVLDAVPPTSSQYVPAQVTAIRVRLAPAPGQQWVPGDDLAHAGRQLGQLRIDPMLRQHLTAEVLAAALNRVLGGQPVGPELLGSQTDERGLRSGLEASYRAQARLAPVPRRRIELVDLANQVRPRTWS